MRFGKLQIVVCNKLFSGSASHISPSSKFLMSGVGNSFNQFFYNMTSHLFTLSAGVQNNLEPVKLRPGNEQ